MKAVKLTKGAKSAQKYHTRLGNFFGTFNDEQLVNRFHQTSFTLESTWLIFLILMVCLLLGNILLPLILNTPGFEDGSPTYYLTVFGVLEVFPLLLVSGIFGNRGTKQAHNRVKSFFQAWARWANNFWRDLKRNWLRILVLTAIAVALQVILTNLFTYIGILAGDGSVKTPQSANTASLETAFQSNYLVLIVTGLIAPMFEELLFRYLIPDMITGIFKVAKMWHGFSRFVGIVFSAIIFSTIHDGTSNAALVFTYFIIALYLQWIRHKTGSITAGVMTHAGSNIVVMLLSLI